jgi:hypothetical protein
VFESLLPCIDFQPVNLSSASETFFNGSVEDANRCLPDIRPYAIPFDVGHDGFIRNDEFPFRGILDLLCYQSFSLLPYFLLFAPINP